MEQCLQVQVQYHDCPKGLWYEANRLMFSNTWEVRIKWSDSAVQTMKWRKLNTLETEKLNYWWALNSYKYRTGTHGEREFIGTGFPGGSDGKESACNAGNSGLILWLGRSSGEGNGYPLQHYLEKPMDWGPRRATSMGLQRVRHDWVTHTTTFIKVKIKWSRSVMSNSLWPHGL